MYIIVSMFKSIKEYFTFTDCLFFGAIISATDPGNFMNMNIHTSVRNRIENCL